MRIFLFVCSNCVAATTQGIMHNLNPNPFTHRHSTRWRFRSWLQVTLKGARVVRLVWVGSLLGVSVSTTPQTVKFSLYENRAIAQIATPVDPGEATPAPKISPEPGTSPAPETSPQPEGSPAPETSPQPPATPSPLPQPNQQQQTTPEPTQSPIQASPTPTPTEPAQPTPAESPTQESPTPSPSPSVEVTPGMSPTVSPTLEAAPTPAPESTPAAQTSAGFPWWVAVGIGGVAIAGGAWAFTRKAKPPEPLDWAAAQPTLPDDSLPPAQAALPAPTIPLSEVKFIPKPDRIGHSTVKTPGSLGMNFNVAVKLRPDSNGQVTIATKTNPAAAGNQGEPPHLST